MNEPTSISAALRQASTQLAVFGESARLEAELLLCTALNCPRSWLYAHADESLVAEPQAIFMRLLQQRLAGQPVAYLTGRQEFWSLALKVSPAVLVPRADTELLVELALAQVAALTQTNPPLVIELGTGSGAIAIALATERPELEILATDISCEALQVAEDNARDHGCRIRFLQSDWFASIPPARAHLIVSNPPYIRQDDSVLTDAGLRFEPLQALASGDDGLDAIRTIIRDAGAYLQPGGQLLLEHGRDQAQAIRKLLHAQGFVEPTTHTDLAGNDRVTTASWPST